MAEIKCARCVAEYINTKNSNYKKPEEEREPLPEIQNAITWAPSWQKTMVGAGQMVLACVPSPTCMGHLEVKEISPQERVLGSGLALPGMS